MSTGSEVLLGRIFWPLKEAVARTAKDKLEVPCIPYLDTSIRKQLSAALDSLLYFSANDHISLF